MPEDEKTPKEPDPRDVAIPDDPDENDGKPEEKGTEGTISKKEAEELRKAITDSNKKISDISELAESLKKENAEKAATLDYLSSLTEDDDTVPDENKPDPTEGDSSPEEEGAGEGDGEGDSLSDEALIRLADALDREEVRQGNKPVSQEFETEIRAELMALKLDKQLDQLKTTYPHMDREDVLRRLEDEPLKSLVDLAKVSNDSNIGKREEVRTQIEKELRAKFEEEQRAKSLETTPTDAPASKREDGPTPVRRRDPWADAVSKAKEDLR